MGIVSGRVCRVRLFQRFSFHLCQSISIITTKMSTPHFTEPTTHYWQEILPASHIASAPWKYGVPVALPDSRVLVLPIRPLNNGKDEAVASLLVNQSSIPVVAELGAFLTEKVKEFDPEVIIGLPTLGLSIAPLVAQGLGLQRYVPLGYSRKFWYDEELSADISSITSPKLGHKKVYIDPHQLVLVKGKKTVIIDDAVSSGTTLKATWELLEQVGCEIIGCGVVMKQGDRWRKVLGEERAAKTVWVFESPLLRKVEDGWDVRS
ncbi:phosphoribosyltransferase-like protein [Bisporella sp. PMI_857]|nr:phosphoribosyltransferase-like protein [Bisporella sp. PMI_857]